LPSLEDMIRRRWPELAPARIAFAAEALREGEHVQLVGGTPSGRGTWVDVKYVSGRPPGRELTEHDLDERVTAWPDRSEGPAFVYRNPAFEMPSEARAQAEVAMREREQFTRATEREE
jgi:hypothetical protein